MADMNFSKMHGCACGGNGVKVATRPGGDKPVNTREREVDVFHNDTGVTHTNVVRFGQPMTLKDGSRWVPMNER